MNVKYGFIMEKVKKLNVINNLGKWIFAYNYLKL
jgi:hypothetical protein